MVHRRTSLIAASAVVVLFASAAAPVASVVGQRGSGAGTGTGGGRGTGPVAVPATPSVGAARGRSGRPPAEKSPAGIALEAAAARIKTINKAVAALDKAALRTMPKNLSAADQQQWSDLGSWIVSAKTRYAQHAQALTKATQTVGDDMDLLGAISELDQPFVTLQAAVQEEAAKFTNLGKPARSRYDAAMSAIKGIK